MTQCRSRQHLQPKKKPGETPLREQDFFLSGPDAGGDPCAEDKKASVQWTKETNGCNPQGDITVCSHTPKNIKILMAKNHTRQMPKQTNETQMESHLQLRSENLVQRTTRSSTSTMSHETIAGAVSSHKMDTRIGYRGLSYENPKAHKTQHLV